MNVLNQFARKAGMFGLFALTLGALGCSSHSASSQLVQMQPVTGVMALALTKDAQSNRNIEKALCHRFTSSYSVECKALSATLPHLEGLPAHKVFEVAQENGASHILFVGGIDKIENFSLNRVIFSTGDTTSWPLGFEANRQIYLIDSTTGQQVVAGVLTASRPVLSASTMSF
ncbi:hypothetical protein CWI84_03950 [Idiomarina tyrosinivorans]|uniref:DUF4154 domain-containing protein n=1 Tax=Idiomarina tyrosinivorans TaxID=1445662 RepID=A0A432ZS77_9GAMM|nr:hypothetical protein [Idiomarina tyrosinivorans]RUO80747.1 hypothetical protein CWI84_03950 [Idiomarina tyrosinivorans]